MNCVVIGRGRGEHALVWKLAQSRHAEHTACIPGNGGISSLAECVPLYDLDLMVQYLQQAQPDLVLLSDPEAMQAGLSDALTLMGIPVFGLGTQGVAHMLSRYPAEVPQRTFCVHAFCDGSHLLWTPVTYHGTDPEALPKIARRTANNLLFTVITAGNALLKDAKEQGYPFRGIFRFYLLLKGANPPQIAAARPGMDEADAQVLLPMLKTDLPDLLDACMRGNLSADSFVWHKGGCACVQVNRETAAENAPVEGLGSLPRDAAAFYGDVSLKERRLHTAGTRVMGIVFRGEDSREALQRAASAATQLVFPGKCGDGFSVMV